MPSPKDGSSQTLVNPASPRSAKEADDAVSGASDQGNPGQAGSAAGGNGGGGGASGSSGGGAGGPVFKPADGSTSADPEKSAWIEIVLVDDASQPVAGEAYSITLPDGSIASGTTDENGLGRVQGFAPGSCQVTFPNLDGQSWKPA